MNASRVGDELRLTRLRLRIRQREVAAALGVSPSVISAIENCWRQPNQREIEGICSALGIRPQDLGEDAS